MEVTRSVDITVPPEILWSFISEPARILEWYIPLEKFEYTGERRNEVDAPFYYEEKTTGVLLSAGSWPKKQELVCEFQGEKNMFHFHLFNHGEQFDSFSYQLIYGTGGLTESVVGQEIELEEEFERDIFLGTCSEEDCVADEDFDDLELEIDLDGPTKMRLGCRWQWRENDWHKLEFSPEE